MRWLTTRQTAILDFIKAERQGKGRSPSYREIGQHFGIASLQGVERHVSALVKKGRLTRDGRKPRSLTTVEGGVL